jgi:hypothetical protein
MRVAHDGSKRAKESVQEIIVIAHCAPRLENEMPPGSGAALLIRPLYHRGAPALVK